MILYEDHIYVSPGASIYVLDFKFREIEQKSCESPIIVVKSELILVNGRSMPRNGRTRFRAGDTVEYMFHEGLTAIRYYAVASTDPYVEYVVAIV